MDILKVRFDYYCFRTWHVIVLGYVYGLDVSLDGNVVVGCSSNALIADSDTAVVNAVIAHSTATGAVLWRKEMPGNVHTLRIHGGVVVVPVYDSNTVVLDVITGQQLHTLPSAGEYVYGICVFHGLKCDVLCLVYFLMLNYSLSIASKDSLEGG
jgi:outer membrane protein assembly factor BamB